MTNDNSLQMTKNNAVSCPSQTWLQENVNEKNFWSHFQKKKSPGDGHCFVYSVMNYFAACDALDNLEYNKLLEDILFETEQNIDTYRCFFDDRSIAQLRFQMHDYVRNKNYDSRFGDLIPLITANLLNTNIMMIKEESGANTLELVVPTTNQGNASSHILLFKRDDHYDACIPADFNKETTMFPANIFKEKVNRSHEAGNSTKESKFSKPRIKFGHVNARSLYPKLDEINAVVVKLDFDVFCVGETWLGERFKDKDVEIPDYNIYRKDRVDALGGCVCIYIKTISPLK